MPVNITDVDTFTATLTCVAAGDAANGANELSHAQKVANRTRYLYNRLTTAEGEIDALQTALQAVLGHFHFTATATNHNSKMPIGLTGSYFRTGSWTISSDEVTVPEAGVYLVFVTATCALPQTGSNGARGGEIQIMVGASSYMAGAEGYVYYDSDSVNGRFSGIAMIPIATPASERIWFRASNGATDGQITPKSAGSLGKTHQIMIMKVGET